MVTRSGNQVAVGAVVEADDQTLSWAIGGLAAAVVSRTDECFAPASSRAERKSADLRARYMRSLTIETSDSDAPPVRALPAPDFNRALFTKFPSNDDEGDSDSESSHSAAPVADMSSGDDLPDIAAPFADEDKPRRAAIDPPAPHPDASALDHTAAGAASVPLRALLMFGPSASETKEHFSQPRQLTKPLASRLSQLRSAFRPTEWT